ncbi:cytochrome c6 PetJ [Lyngbya sp. CCY1209]|uniref:cytochrome c6 PetJ n=1 Tax=Lyngbya sp. CCY1209 TaxID=2886103 RepID=UPI002D2170EE|nr:c-type cytochrome [Lyngbya sp. CCY1209]MEB3884318.1 c-type cytochrome [Lyngbya sp. CCY1209]
MMLRNLLTAFVLGVMVWVLGFGSPAIAEKTDTGAQIFSAQCAGCHAGGGNIVRWWKTLKKGALKRNGYDSVESISEIVANGKSNMSAYKNRLSEAEIRRVAAYVLEQAEKDWR